MEIIKKYGIKILSALALIALFFPMATVEVGSFYSTSLSGFTIAFQGYICLLLIVGPAVIIAADYISIIKKFNALVQCGVSVLGIILTFVGYLQASKIAAAGESAGMGFVDCDASFGFGGILCILCYIGILVLTVLYQKDELKANIEALKGSKE